MEWEGAENMKKGCIRKTLAMILTAAMVLSQSSIVMLEEEVSIAQ